MHSLHRTYAFPAWRAGVDHEISRVCEFERARMDPWINNTNLETPEEQDDDEADEETDNAGLRGL